MVDDHDLLGRDAELAALESVLENRQSQLVLLVGGPRTGKSQLMRALRARARERTWSVLPAELGDQAGLTVGKGWTAENFRIALGTPDLVPAAGPAGDAESEAPQLVLIYGYRPSEELHDWFAEEFARRPGQDDEPPRVVVVAGDERDLERLMPLPAVRLDLGPLGREPIVAALRALDATLADPLEEGELEAYADAIRTDPDVFDALRRVLPLTTAAAPPAPADGGP